MIFFQWSCRASRHGHGFRQSRFPPGWLAVMVSVRHGFRPAGWPSRFPSVTVVVGRDTAAATAAAWDTTCAAVHAGKAACPADGGFA